MTRIRPAHPAEIALLQDVERDAARRFATTGTLSATAAEGVVTAAEHQEAIDAGLALAAELEGEVVGFAMGFVREDAAYLHEVSVRERCGGRGIGRALVEAFAAAGAERGAARVVLSTFRDVAWNGPFYRRLGFVDLEEAELRPWMREIREAQAAAGLDVERRCFMQRRSR